MSESDDENEHFCFFGKPLDPYDEDSVPKRRPISVEEQIATDAQGRRRFHGAFTGGFSAGFFNTVGSLEGWTPSEFKSSRSEKSKGLIQQPRDFMDDEDLGEDGIAPQVVRATSDYSSSKKRKKQVFSEGPIPGEPVLHNILTSGNETIGYMLLKNLRMKDHRKRKVELVDAKTYSCEMPKDLGTNEFNDVNQYEIPEIYKEFLSKPKNNTFGLGYLGLDKSHFSLFPMETKSKLVVTDRNNKKLSIAGQAFGVGAFEDEDEDIYMKEDMTKYDFELVGEKEKMQPKNNNKTLILDMFMPSIKTPVLKNKMIYPPPTIPHSFTGKHKVRKSRFEPIVEEKDEEEVPSSSRINPMIRAKYLGEETDNNYTASKSFKEPAAPKKEDNNTREVSEPNNPLDEINSYLADRFVSASKKEDVSNILEPVEKTETIHGTEQMRAAVKMKMFGPLTRVTSDWAPCALLCKRFNVPEPLVERPTKSRTRTKNIIFEYQKHNEEINLPPGLKKEENESPSTSAVDNSEPIDTVVPDQEADNKNSSEIKSEVAESVDLRPKDITERIDLEQQQDLFKAIFLSSDSESEKEDDVKKEPNESATTNDDNRKQELKTAVMSDQLIPKIKPMKEGVLSGINFHKFVKPTIKTEETSEVEKPSVPSEIGCYGPKIPEKIPVQIKRVVNIVSSESDDEWVEKDSDNQQKKKHKKERKHKKHKHKKKKNKE